LSNSFRPASFLLHSPRFLKSCSFLSELIVPLLKLICSCSALFSNSPLFTYFLTKRIRHKSVNCRYYIYLFVFSVVSPAKFAAAPARQRWFIPFVKLLPQHINSMPLNCNGSHKRSHTL